MNKPTLVIGASTNPRRYAFLAIRLLTAKHFEVYAIGLKEGNVHGIHIEKPFPALPTIHTITLYIGKRNQASYYDYMISLRPKRVIFNPGSENAELENLLKDQGLEVIHDCTLVMLRQGSY